MSTAEVRANGGWAVGLSQIIEASGPDAQDFLQGQLSQDIAALAPGESAPSLLLHPTGKIAAWLHAIRHPDADEPARFWLQVDAGWADATVARLERFKLRTACELAIRPQVSVTAFGPAAARLAPGDEVPAVDQSWSGLATRTVFVPDSADTAMAGDPIDPATVTALRIEAGRPAMGAELDESTIPAAAGIIDESVSFTKGCYTGQELVARVDSRGNNVPSRLVGLVGDAEIAPRAELAHDGSHVGHATSAGFSGFLDRPVALAYLRRAVETPAELVVGGVAVKAVELPLVGP